MNYSPMPKTQVFLTIDTELSMGGAWANASLRPVPSERRIFCRVGGDDHGIGWLCDQLNRRKLCATFFVEVFSALVEGEAATRRWISFLIDQGQDVQLHTHLNFYYYSRQAQRDAGNGFRTDNLADLAAGERYELLNRACDLFETLAGRRAVGYRAGNWRGDRALLADLARAGIALDSSFNPALQGLGSFDGETMELDTIQSVAGIRELPLTVAVQRLPGSRTARNLRPFDLMSLSRAEIQKILDDAWTNRLPYVMAVLHSFSGVKAADVQYSRMRPNHVVQRRVQFFLDHICAHPDRFQMSSIKEAASVPDILVNKGRPALSDLGVFRPLLRTAVQAVNNLYWT